jgi:uncharacterized YigZ family protein
MRETDYYNTIETIGTAEFKDRGSRFIAYAFPIKLVKEFKDKFAALKKEHPKARHHCFAYRLGLDDTNFRVSDDGEPSGTAGRPILGQIDSKQVTNVMIVVVRYFGGTLLGVPGLIHAYKSAASMVLQVTSIVRKPVLIYYHLQFDYTKMNDVMMVIKHTDCVALNQEMQLFCAMDIGIPKHRLGEVLIKFGEIVNLSIKEIS